MTDSETPDSKTPDSKAPEATPAVEAVTETAPATEAAATEALTTDEPAAEAPAAAAASVAETADETVADATAETSSDDATADEGAGEAEPEVVPAVVAEPMRNVDARNPIWTVGRRKASSARIRLFPGGGNFMVNGKPLEEFFRLVHDQHAATLPLDHANVRKKYDVWVNVHGGGTTGQSGAIALGVARALIQIEPATEQPLRDVSLLSRDARVKERKKYGRRGARRGFQFSKR